jgi:murein DD-endopeptidase MepM/ murein hydrolase activator NlpD
MNYKVFLALVGLLLLVACSPGIEGETLQEDVIDVADAAANNDPSVVEEVEEVINQLPSESATSGDFEGYGLSYEVDGETFSFDDALVMAQTPVAEFLTVVAPTSVGIQLRTLPNEVGTYTIGQGPRSYREVNVWFPHEGVRYNAGIDAGSGTIVFTSVGTMVGFNYEGDIKGTFEGTFVAADGTEIEVENGVFHAQGLSN